MHTRQDIVMRDEDSDPARDLVAHYWERFLEALGETQCARSRELVEAPGGLISCNLLVERAATVLLHLFAETERGIT